MDAFYISLTAIDEYLILYRRQGPLGGKMNKSNNLYIDIFTGFTLMAGMFVFTSGEFIISSILFCLATISSNLNFGSSFRP
jgi:hypothetical protein